MIKTASAVGFEVTASDQGAVFHFDLGGENFFQFELDMASCSTIKDLLQELESK